MRDDKGMEVLIPTGTISKLIKHNSPNFISVRVPFEIDGFARSSPAKDGGLKVNDRIIGINNLKTPYFDNIHNELANLKSQIVTIVAIRNHDTIHSQIKVSDKGLIGVRVKSLDKYFEFKKKQYTVLEAIPAGTVKAYKMIGDYLKQLKLIFSPETKAYESIGGFITIGNIFPSVWDWHAFWSLTAFLSIILAIMNVLPIPALDGGHVLFLVYEIITRRKPSDKFLEYAQIAGMVILLSLLVFANGNDVMKLFRK